MITGPATPAADHAVSNRPWIAPTCNVPNRSDRYAGIVAKPPPYMVITVAMQATNSGMLPMRPAHGTVAYSAGPSRKNVAYVALRPMRSDAEAHRNRPPMLNRLS